MNIDLFWMNIDFLFTTILTSLSGYLKKIKCYMYLFWICRLFIHHCLFTLENDFKILSKN